MRLLYIISFVRLHSRCVSSEDAKGTDLLVLSESPFFVLPSFKSVSMSLQDRKEKAAKRVCVWSAMSCVRPWAMVLLIHGQQDAVSRELVPSHPMSPSKLHIETTLSDAAKGADIEFQPIYHGCNYIQSSCCFGVRSTLEMHSRCKSL